MNLYSKIVLASIAISTFSCNNEKDAGVTSKITTTTTAITTANPKKFLFDATKAETAGNADWVVDADTSPQRFPTPAQSNVTATTTESFWRGALSAWGIALAKLGHSVETLPSGTAITYGGTGAQDLKNYDVFVVDEPNIRFTSAEKTAILNFVKNGGGLFMISDHTMSDRNKPPPFFTKFKIAVFSAAVNRMLGSSTTKTS